MLCSNGHPMEWNESLGSYVCLPCEEAATRLWFDQLIEKVNERNPNPVPATPGDGFVMLGPPYEPPLREPRKLQLRGADYVLIVVVGLALNAFVGAAVLYGSAPHIASIWSAAP
jgi:hypothetical protein